MVREKPGHCQEALALKDRYLKLPSIARHLSPEDTDDPRVDLRREPFSERQL